MSFKTWGKSGGKPRGTLKLEEWLEKYPGKCDEPFQVIRVTRSQAYSGFSLECTAMPEGFRVFLGESNSLYEAFEADFQELLNNGSPLYVRVTIELWGNWEFETNENFTCEWKRTGGGFSATVAQSKS